MRILTEKPIGHTCSLSLHIPAVHIGYAGTVAVQCSPIISFDIQLKAIQLSNMFCYFFQFPWKTDLGDKHEWVISSMLTSTVSASLDINTSCVVMYCHSEMLINNARFKAWEGEVNFTPDWDYNTAIVLEIKSKRYSGSHAYVLTAVSLGEHIARWFLRGTSCLHRASKYCTVHSELAESSGDSWSVGTGECSLEWNHNKHDNNNNNNNNNLE